MYVKASTINTDDNQKYQPAFEGAKFDTSGYCLKHPMVRLYRPTSEGEMGDWKTVRKVCHMCGEHSLRKEGRSRMRNAGSHSDLKPSPTKGTTRHARSSSSSSRLRSQHLMEDKYNNGKPQAPRSLIRSASASVYSKRKSLVESSSKDDDVFNTRRNNLSRKTQYVNTNRSSSHTFGNQRSISRPTRRQHCAPSMLSISDELDPLPRAKSTGRRMSKYQERDSSLSVVERRERRSFDRSGRSILSKNGDIISRRHSTEVSSSKPVYSSTYNRRVSAPDTSQNAMPCCTESAVNNTSRSSKSTARAMSKNRSLVSSRSSSSITSNREMHQVQHKYMARGRSMSRPKYTEEPHNSSSLRSATSDVRSLFSRGRSKSTSRSTEVRDSVTSAAHSFAKNLRRRSLSRGASKVLETTSEMDGNRDAEHGTQIYDVPFNPATGRCLYHSEVVMAVKNGGKRDGWKIVSLGCPKCEDEEV